MSALPSSRFDPAMVSRFQAQIGFSDEEFVAAVHYAPQTRPGRFTVLEHLDLDTPAIRDAYNDYVKHVSSCS